MNTFNKTAKSNESNSNDEFRMTSTENSANSNASRTSDEFYDELVMS